ncbi:MAG: hypothetical protein OEV74_19505 [Cyclobacteriaceae bacterium]|nr:hypothetical protein [Cyclobacteriaceae bacterium]MDH4298469.1 hypothetical protein [Cyclobacteriaceae bacterium]
MGIAITMVLYFQRELIMKVGGKCGLPDESECCCWPGLILAGMSCSHDEQAAWGQLLSAVQHPKAPDFGRNLPLEKKEQ